MLLKEKLYTSIKYEYWKYFTNVHYIVEYKFYLVIQDSLNLKFLINKLLLITEVTS